MTLLRTTIRCGVALLAAVLLSVAPGWTQTGTTSISGRITDQQGQVVPGATVTITNTATGDARITVTNESGLYQMSALPPGPYRVTVELSGFRTARVENLELRVDLPSRTDVQLEVGSLTETVTVEAATMLINTVNASLGNTLSPEQIDGLPLEARSVVALLSLQPGAVYVPVNVDERTRRDDPRHGAVSGARADQQTVTLDGIDVNDPELQIGYTSAVRITQDALQEFRVSTSNYGAEMGRSSGAQVSMVTRSGTNDYTGSASWFLRRTATSSNEYFLKLAQVSSGKPSEPPKLDKDVWGGAIGGPIRRNRLFFFGNFQAQRDSSESPVVRGVPSNSFRDGVLMYRCADPAPCPGGTVRGFADAHTVPAGWYGLTPAELAAIDPLGLGPSRGASEYFRRYPSPNEPGLDGQNIMDFRFSAPIVNDFHTYIGRLDFKMTDDQHAFGRFNLQDDTINSAPQFPGQPPRELRNVNNFGFAIGHDWVASPSFINSFRYGLTRIDDEREGVTKENYVTFRFIAPFDGAGDTGTFGSTRETPTHNFVNDMSWLKRAHNLKFGTNIRFTRIPRTGTSNSFNSVSINPSWVAGVGRNFMPGRATCTTPGCARVPAVAAGFAAGYADAWLNILGVLSQATRRANYTPTGDVLAVGAPVVRKYASDEYELYVQDSWQLHPTLTVTGGIRYSLMSPPWEVHGFQVAPTVNLGEWFEQRRRSMEQGTPSNRDPLVQFALAGPGNDRPHFYEWDTNNIAPRLAVAWSPVGESGFMRALTGGNQLVVRGGYAKVFDRIGHGLANQFDLAGSFGMATVLSSPFGQPYEQNPAARFRDLTTLPPTLPAAPPGQFPATPPLEAGVITQALDASITTPSAHVFSLAVGRQFGPRWSIEGAYVGRLGRDLPVRRDAAMPLNLRDPRSNTDYFTAAQTLIRAIEQAGGPNVAPIAYWENLFPGLAAPGVTATQAVARYFHGYAPDYISAIWDIDQLCGGSLRASPVRSCSIFGPYAYFNRQYDSLGILSTIGHSKYNALQLTLRNRWGAATQFDFNYTLAKSDDLASAVERGSNFTEFTAGGYSGFLINSWEPELHYGPSDFDLRHQLNFNWIVDLPFGQGRPFGSGATGVMNHLIGDWSIAGLVRWTSGFPFNVYNCRSCWATNWTLQGNAMPKDPNQLPATKTTKNKVDNRPSPFEDPQAALQMFRFAMPGEVGIRNVLRGDGYFTLDTSLSKGWALGIADHRLRFRWDVFNLTNTPKFNVDDLNMFPDRTGFGRYDGTLATCDGRAGRCMQFALRYEF